MEKNALEEDTVRRRKKLEEEDDGYYYTMQNIVAVARTVCVHCWYILSLLCTRIMTSSSSRPLLQIFNVLIIIVDDDIMLIHEVCSRCDGVRFQRK